MDFDEPSVDVVPGFTNTYLNQCMALTFDLQHQTRSSVAANEYSL